MAKKTETENATRRKRDAAEQRKKHAPKTERATMKKKAKTPHLMEVLRKRRGKAPASSGRVEKGVRKKKFVPIDVPDSPLTKADKEKLKGTRRRNASRCPHCGEINCFVSEKWWLRDKQVRCRRKVCRSCRKNHMTYEVVEPLFLKISKKTAKKVEK